MEQYQTANPLTKWQQIEDRLYEGLLRPDKFGGLGALLLPGGMIMSARKEARDDRLNPIEYPVINDLQRRALRIRDRAMGEQIYLLASFIEAMKFLVYYKILTHADQIAATANRMYQNLF